MIGFDIFIKEWGNLGALGVMSITVAILLIYTTVSIIRMLKKEVKDLYKNSEKNILLNTKSAMIQARTASSMDKIEQAVRNTLELSNGKNPQIAKILKRLDKLDK